MSWVTVLLGVLGLAAFIIYRVVTGRNSSKSEIVAETKEKVRELRAQNREEVSTDLKKVEEDQKELDRIDEIQDEDEELQALADFANRKRR